MIVQSKHKRPWPQIKGLLGSEALGKAMSACKIAQQSIFIVEFSLLSTVLQPRYCCRESWPWTYGCLLLA